MLKQINNYSGVVGVVYLDEEVKKFAIVHSKRGFSLPGGGFDDEDASIEDGLYREIKEELGLDIKDVKIKKTDLTEEFKYDSNKDGREDQYVIRPIYLVKAKNNKLSSVIMK